MPEGHSVTVQLQVPQRSRGRATADQQSARRIPRVAKLMALAIRCERLLQGGVIADQAELARLGHVSRARVTQIMNLLNLAPDLQELLLFLPPVAAGRDPLTERALRRVVAEPDWRKQREMFFRPEFPEFSEFREFWEFVRFCPPGA